MKQFVYFFLLLISISSCKQGFNNTTFFNLEKLDKIEVLNCLSGSTFFMKADFGPKLFASLNSAKTTVKDTFTKKYLVIIQYKTGVIDTLLTDGTLFTTANKTFRLPTNFLENYRLDTFFDFDKLLRYHIKINEGNLFFREDNRLTKQQRLLNDLVINDKPKSLADTLFISQLENLGFLKHTIPQKNFKSINSIFSVKQAKEHYSNSCAAVFRDIFVFKKNNKIVGLVKICFTCDQYKIIGTTKETINFGQNGEYEKLRKLLIGSAQ